MKKWMALTRDVAPTIDQCLLTYIKREPITFEKAYSQHKAYRDALTSMGIDVVNAPNPMNLPDGVFMEDPAIVVDECAVVTRMGSESRQAEVESFAKILEPYRKLFWIQAPGTIEGGDVLRIKRKLYAGLSTRTNVEGAKQLESFLKPFGYEVVTTKVRGCLHLKTGCTYVGKNTVLINPDWVDASIFSEFNVIETDPSEPFAANAVYIEKLDPMNSGNEDQLLYASNFPKTKAKLESNGFNPKYTDISELMKAEAGLTCLSQIFRIL